MEVKCQKVKFSQELQHIMCYSTPYVGFNIPDFVVSSSLFQALSSPPTVQ